MDLKELKKLAAACRKAGISHFKSEQYEFTLTEEQPKSAYKLTKETAKSAGKLTSNAKFESDSLSEDELMFWSTGTTNELLGTEDKN